MVIERLFIAMAIILLGILAWGVIQRVGLRRAAAQATRDPVLAGLRPGVPAILYFTTPVCVPCRTQQRPAIYQLQAELGPNIQVIEVDATQHPEAADRWGVFSAPTTFVLDGQLKPRHVNRGVATAATLREQVGAGG